MADMAHLIEPVIPALRRYARTFVRDAGAADDLVQDTLERAISRWHQRHLLKNFRSFTVQVVEDLNPPPDCHYWWAPSMAVVCATL